MTAPLPGLIIAAAHSGAGKTSVTLSVLRALARRQEALIPAKVGPDYIDPQFHRLASGKACVNLDTWAMKPNQIIDLINAQRQQGSWVLAEGVMGLFDGTAGMGRSGHGSTADLAALTGWPVVLVMDATGQGATMAAVVRGLRDHRPHITIAAVVLNKVGSGSHVDLLRLALEEVGIPVLGAIPKGALPHIGSRHLGLHQAVELRNMAKTLDTAADAVLRYLDVSAFAKIAGAWTAHDSARYPVLVPPLGQRIAVAHDPSSAFVYDHVLEGWQQAGASLMRFSPIEDQGPDPDCDAIYLPGGYPELYAGKLAAAQNFKSSMRRAAEAGIAIYGECGGYMVLGRGLVDQRGHRHAMLGLLEHETSFQTPKLHLGYRTIDLVQTSVLGRTGTRVFGHEFHYASLITAGQDQPLGQARDAGGREVGLIGGCRGSVAGSFFHLIAL